MIRCLSTTPAQTAPPNRNKTMPPKIITSQNPSPCCCPNKESNLVWRFNFPNTFPRKCRTHITMESLIVRANIKSPILPQAPLNSIFILMIRGLGMKKMKESNYLIDFAIIKISTKLNTPLSSRPSTITSV
jgi:hypothetical protein